MNNSRSMQIFGYLMEMMKLKNGWIVQSQMGMLTFEYWGSVDEFQRKKITIIFEERKSSYRLSAMSKIDFKVLSKGTFNLLKTIEKFNKNVPYDNSLYYYNEPDIFAIRCILEKDTLEQLIDQQQLSYLKKIIETTIIQFSLYVARIADKAYEEEMSQIGMKEVVEFVNLYKTSVTQEINKRNISVEETEGNEKQFKIVESFGMNPCVRYEAPPNQYELGRMNFYIRKFKGEKSSSSKDSQQVTKPLAHKIIMMKQRVDKNWKAPQSSYGSLERVQAEYITISSFNDAAAELIDRQRKEIQPRQSEKSDKLNRNVLVRKNFKKKDKCTACAQQINPICQCYVRLKSFQTEIVIVSCIRNVMAESIASYFLELNDQQQPKLAKLYSKFYPKCLSSQKIKPNDILPLILHFLDALKIFDNLNILHRDLKPDNILIDSKKVPKIIDFGSAWVQNKSMLGQKDFQINNQLYTTKKYNLYYEQAIFSQRQKMTSKQFQQHPLFDMHAFGVILREIFTGSEVSAELGSFMLMNLSWLSSKCMSHNPNMRLNAHQAENFCSLLAKFWSFKSQAYK